MTDAYSGREQTKAKHFILKRYLQALAFKVLTFSDITYVDGFSGPWETKTENFSDSSFMIAIAVLQDAQKQILARGHQRRIRCFFSESDPKAFAQLEEAVAIFHKPEEGFEIKTYCGKFEDAVSEIQAFTGPSFPLIFIDPTGWTGYPFDKIRPLFLPSKCEVLINFMYDFVNRFAQSDDEATIASLNPILGGPGWGNPLDPTLRRGPAVEKLFRDTLKSEGDFDFVISTRIDMVTAERPHFFIAYGTKSLDGLKTFRQTEYDALREHEKNRANVKEKQREERSNMVDLFSGHQAAVQEATIDDIVDEQKALASADLMATLALNGPLRFSGVVARLLQTYMIRETNVKDICVDLARAGKIENTWGGAIGSRATAVSLSLERLRAKLIECDAKWTIRMTQQYDIFICHASEDKEGFVRPLAGALRRLGVSVWYDEFSLEIGDSVSRQIDIGIAGARFGIVVISRSFIGRPWPEHELRGLVNRDVEEDLKILPIWHGVSKRDVSAFSPSLSDKFAIDTQRVDAQEAAIQILRTVRPDLYQRHPRTELERMASGEALAELQGEIEELRDQVAEYQRPHCGAPLSTRIDAPVDPEQKDWDLVDTYECGFQTFGGTIQHPCPSDPKFPSLDDYIFICERTSDMPRHDWRCYARPKTEMARKVHLDIVYGRSEDEVRRKVKATYLYRAGRITSQEWFRIQMGAPPE